MRVQQDKASVLFFNCRKGLLDFTGTDFDAGVISYEFEGFKAVSCALPWKNRGGFGCSIVNKCKLEVSPHGNTLKLSVENNSAEDVFLKTITISFLPSDVSRRLVCSDYLEYVHASDFSACPGVKKVGLSDRYLKHNPESSFVYVIFNIQNNNSYLFSVLPPHNGDFVTFRALHDSLHLEGNFGLEIRINFQALIRPGRKIASSLIQFRQGNNPREMLAELGRQWKEGLKLRQKKTLIGWNSWDYYAGAITSGDIYENQRAAKKTGGRVKYFIIDEGYEPQWGVWDANHKFPEGLRKFCNNIKTKGGIPGVWTAALLVNTYNPLYRNNPGWFARKSNGEIFVQQLGYGPMACLDITNPEVETHVLKVFRRLKSFGFEYFKVDFTQIVLLCDKFGDPTVPRGNIIRKAFATIRRAIGQESYLLACGAPFESVTGIVDAARTSGDIHNYWSHIIANARSSFARWWMHGNLWNNDPDFLIVRCKETSADKLFNRKLESRPFAGGDFWMSGREMNYNEAEVYALSVYLTAGDIMLGDNLKKLNDKGIRLLKRVIDSPKLAKPAVPLDLFKGHDRMPSVLLAEEGDFWVLGLFNWEENAATISVALGELGIKDYQKIESFFGDKTPDFDGNTLEFKLNPRSCRGFFIIKKGNKQQYWP